MVRNYKRKTEDRWSKEDLLEALICIKEAKLKINDAARQFGISRATLYRQYQKFILAGGKYDVNQFRTCGGNPILTKVEEDVLEKTIRDLREQGFTVTSSDIKRICFEYCDSNGIPNQFNQEKRMASDDWYYGFLKRHPDVRIPKPGGNGTRTSTSSGSNSNIADDILDFVPSTTTTTTTPDKSPKSKKLKASSPKKTLKLEKSPNKSPVHDVTASPSRATSPKKEKQPIQPPTAVSPIPAKGRKQKPVPPVIAPVVKKSLKRLDRRGGGRRGRKGKARAILPDIPSDDDIKTEPDDDDEEVDEDTDGGQHDDEESVEMETEEVVDEEEEEEEDDDEEAEDGVEPEDDDVEMVEEEEEQEQDEVEKSDSEEEEEGDEEEAEGEEEEEAEDGEQEDGEEDADGENEVEEGDEEEGDEEDDEEEEEEEEDDDDDDEDDVVKTETDNSNVECSNDEELLEKLLDM